MRERASSAVTGLARLAARGGTVIEADGGRHYLPLDQIRPGMTLAILPGDRVPVDVRIRRGGTDVDRSIVTGESAPVPAGPGDGLEAGSLNLTGAVEAEVLRPAGESFLAEVTRMLEAAEHGRGRYVRLADRAARLYAPVVHLLAAATFVGWFVVTGGDWRAAIFTAISVLIITCPCALGLAVPVVHVVASGRLFRAGIMVRDGSALERMASDHAGRFRQDRDADNRNAPGRCRSDRRSRSRRRQGAGAALRTPGRARLGRSARGRGRRSQ